MSEDNNLGEALLKQAAGATPAPDPRKTAEAVSRRQGRRLRLWTGLAIFLWTLAGGYCVLNAWVLLTFFYPKLADWLMHPPEAGHGGAAGEFLGFLAEYLLYSNIVWPVLLVAAAWATILFVVKSRQATLRQIQATLDDISRQLTAQSKQR